MTLHDKLERAVDEMSHIEEAMEALKQVRGMGNVLDILRDCLIVLGFERDQLHAKIEAVDAREEAEQTREYWSAVI